MHRRDFVKSVVYGIAAVSTGGRAWALGTAAAKPRPNVILINIDDLGWRDLGCFGSSFHETPNADRLCSEGMKFTDAYAACAVCAPTRAAIMTGQYPARIGITNWKTGGIPKDRKNPEGYKQVKDLLIPKNHQFLELERVTIAEVLKPLGYATCHIGKWHLGNEPWHPDKQGFDENIGGCHYGQPPSYFDPYSNEKHVCMPTLSPRRKGEYLTDREADEAVQFIRKNKDRPFFVHLCHYAVHEFIAAKKEMVEKYEKKPRNGYTGGWKKDDAKTAIYAAMVESVDLALGRIMDLLDELGLAGNTMIIFTSDNGGLAKVTDNSPLRKGKAYPYEGGIRIPQIIRWPGVVRPGTVCSEPVTSVDFMPTVCEAVGVPLPKGKVIDGVSMMPLLRGKKTLGRDAIYWHYPHYKKMEPYSIVRSGDWKLIRFYADTPPELYNLKDDIGETKNLAKENPEKFAELSEKLDHWLAATGAKLPKPVADHAGNR